MVEQHIDVFVNRKKVLGGDGASGSGNCKLRGTSSGGVQWSATITVSGSTCNDQKAACAAAGSDWVNQGLSGVHYDSGCDGWGH